MLYDSPIKVKPGLRTFGVNNKVINIINQVIFFSNQIKPTQFQINKKD